MGLRWGPRGYTARVKTSVIILAGLVGAASMTGLNAAAPAELDDSVLEALDKKGFVAPNRRLKSFLTTGNEDDDGTQQPIADLFPNCTVLFADIAGFTAWSSTRDPAQVFVLLQSVYQAFDVIAKRRKVFKVEVSYTLYVLQ